MNKLSLISLISANDNKFKSYIKNLTKNFDFNLGEIILVVDIANIEALNFIKDNCGQFKVVELNFDENTMLAYNHGVLHAGSEIVVFLDFDTSIPKTFAKKILEAFSLNEKIGAASCISSHYEKFFIPRALGFSVDDMNKRLIAKHKAKYPAIASCDGVCLCVNKELFKKTGGFDETIQVNKYAKKEFALKLSKMGYKNILIDNLYVYKNTVSDFCDIQKRRLAESAYKKYKERRDEFPNDWCKKFPQSDFVLKIEKEMFPVRRSFFGVWKYPNKTRIKVVFLCKTFHLKTPKFLVQKYKEDAKTFKKDRPTIVVMEAKIPEFDKNAGDKSIWHIINSYLKMNFNVIFAPDDYLQYEPYSSIMREKGIKLINDFGVFNINMFFDWLKYNAKNIDYFLLVRPNVSIKYLDKIRKYKNIKILYYGQDLHFLREERDYELTKNKNSLIMCKKFKKMEKRLIKEAKISYFPSFVEKELANSLLPKSNVEVVPVYMYKTDNEPNILPFDDRKNLLFIGGFIHKPNADGVLWFINEIFDKIKKEIPDIKFNIAGSNPSSEILRLQSENINVLGFISDEELSKLYKSTRVVVAPLRFGAGMKGKVVEALYNKCPIVTTSIGAEGINNLNNAITVADDAETFAKKVVELYLNKELNEKKSNNSFKIIENQFSDKIMLEVLQKGVL